MYVLTNSLKQYNRNHHCHRERDRERELAVNTERDIFNHQAKVVRVVAAAVLVNQRRTKVVSILADLIMMVVQQHQVNNHSLSCNRNILVCVWDT